MKLLTSKFSRSLLWCLALLALCSCLKLSNQRTHQGGLKPDIAGDEDLNPDVEPPKDDNGEVKYSDLEPFQDGGTIVGNGGDAIICLADDKDTITSVEILDVYETRERWDLKLDLGSKNLSVNEKIKLALERLATLDPKRSAVYQSQLDQLDTLIKFLPHTKLPDVEDTNHVALPKNCLLSQIAIQPSSTTVADKPIIIAEDLYNLLSSDNKAALIVHELVYLEAKSNELLDSTGVRFLNAKLISNDISKTDLRSYLNNVVKPIKLPYEFRNQKIDLDKANFLFYTSGEIRGLTLDDGYTFGHMLSPVEVIHLQRFVYFNRDQTIHSGEINFKKGAEIPNCGGIYEGERAEIAFGKDEAIEKISGKNFRACQKSIFPNRDPISFPEIYVDVIFFKPDRNVDSVTLTEERSDQVWPTPTQDVILCSGTRVGVTPELKLHSGYICDDKLYLKKSEESVNLNGHRAYFTENGEILFSIPN